MAELDKLCLDDHYFTGSEMDAFHAKFKDAYNVLEESESRGAFRFISNASDRERLYAFPSN